MTADAPTGDSENGSDASDDTDAAASRRPRRRSALLWGAVAALLFPALLLAYRVGTGELPIGPAPAAAVALVLGAVVAVAAYGIEHRLAEKGRT